MREFIHFDPRLPAKPFFVVGRDRQLLEAEVQARRVEMGFADIGGLIARVAQLACERMRIIPGLAVLVTDHALGIRRHARHQRAAGGDARGAGGIAAGKGRTLPGE